MVITLTLQQLGMIVLGIALLVLIIVCIVAVVRLAAVLKDTDKIVRDAQAVSAIAATRAQDIDSLVGDAAVSIGAVTEAIKGNQSTVKAVTNLTNAVAALISMFQNASKSDKKSEK